MIEMILQTTLMTIISVVMEVVTGTMVDPIINSTVTILTLAAQLGAQNKFFYARQACKLVRSKPDSLFEVKPNLAAQHGQLAICRDHHVAVLQSRGDWLIRS